MNPLLTKFLSDLSSGKRPDLPNVGRWLSTVQLDSEEWEEISDALVAAYSLRDASHLADLLGMPDFKPGGLVDYVDEFSKLMDRAEITGLIRTYVEHTRNMEAPTAFHFGTILAVLGAVLKRKTWLDQGYYKIWPAMQVMLVGPSGKVKKSTAAGYAINLVFEAAGKDLIHLFPDEGSGEALKSELSSLTRKHGEACGLLFVSELGTFLGKQEYNINLVQTLTDLFDSRTHKRRRTVARNSERMANIAVSALLCSNEDWLADAIPASAFRGGFMGRMLVFYEHGTDRIVPRPTLPDPGIEEAIRADLIRASLVNGEAVLTPQANTWFDRRYRELKEAWPEDERLVPFWERIPEHILRMGMSLSISEDPKQRDGVSVDAHHLRQADAVVAWICDRLPRIYSLLGNTTFGTDQGRIYEAIRRRGGKIEEGELGRIMARRMGSKMLDEHLATMVRNGVIERRRLNAWEGKYEWRLVRKM